MAVTDLHQRLKIYDEIDPSALLIDPAQARDKLEKLGYSSDIWGHILDSEKGSHYVRALINIANTDSDQPVSLNDIYNEQYPEKFPQSPEDIFAEELAEEAAANGAWDTLPKV